MIREGNVFEVREHAKLAWCTPIVEHCEKYVKKNAESLDSFEKDEIAVLQAMLHEGSGSQARDGHEVAALKEELAERNKHFGAIAEIVRK
ncbi:hypothetical protein MVEG_02407 [Podila verticillata NRRL 6337]|nr:hypothetical protein MVEG_02407 [Podila verticillata NRRL 6337]